MIITAIVYDYILTFPSEVEYIWSKPWSLVFALFVTVRYLGLCGFMIYSFLGSSFLPGPANLCGALNILGVWTNNVYICTADLVMILRLWAMYNRSKIILGILLTSYLAEIIASIIANIVYSNPEGWEVPITQVLDLSFCLPVPTSASWGAAADLSQLVHAGVMCILVIIQFTVSSLEMYRATKQWRLGPFINLLVVEGMAYFLAILMWSIVNVLYDFQSQVTSQQGVALYFLGYAPVCTLTPRFILSMRELYARSVSGGRGHGIDSGFGMAPLSNHRVSLANSSIIFPGGGELEGLGRDSDDTAIPMYTRKA